MTRHRWNITTTPRPPIGHAGRLRPDGMADRSGVMIVEKNRQI
jgi:hypothetical protein